VIMGVQVNVYRDVWIEDDNEYRVLRYPVASLAPLIADAIMTRRVPLGRLPSMHFAEVPFYMAQRQAKALVRALTEDDQPFAPRTGDWMWRDYGIHHTHPMAPDMGEHPHMVIKSITYRIVTEEGMPTYSDETT